MVTGAEERGDREALINGYRVSAVHDEEVCGNRGGTTMMRMS